MTYELAKLLKDAGFSQFGKGTWTYPPDKIVTHYTDRVYDPTLSELIEACGETFDSLRRVGFTDWQAEDRSYTGSGPVFCGNSTEEAVARLWLALHEATARTARPLRKLGRSESYS